MKKFIFSLFAFLLVMALASCGGMNLNPVPDEGGVSRDDDDDGGSSRELKRYVTMRIADAGENDSGSIGIGMGNTIAASRSESRALTYANAVASHDFFEVVFYHSDTGRIARAVWNIGEPPEISGIYRTTGGINYGHISSTTGATEGAAVLFAGSGEDKTLLALGRLMQVEDFDKTTLTTSFSASTVTNNTIAVTFEVAALKSGVGRTTLVPGSFRTYTNLALTAPATEIEEDIFIHYVDKTKVFPMYRLGVAGVGNVRWGAYTFELDPAASSPFNFDGYAAGIVLVGDRRYEARNPRYIVTDGQYQYSTFLQQDLNMMTGVGGGLIMENNDAANTPFENPVKFKFDTSASQVDSVFALAFEIYVNNLTQANSSVLPDGRPPKFLEPVKWRISTGIGTKWLDLDDGYGGEGGAIFLGNGNITAWVDSWRNGPPIGTPP